MKNRRDAISLITLIITIVVIVILVGAIELSISNNNPINQAQKAVIRHDISSMLDHYNIVYASELGKNNGDATRIDETSFVEVVPNKYKLDFKASVEGIKYNCKDEIIKEIIKEMNTEKIILTCELPKPIINNVKVDNITETTAKVTIDALPIDSNSTIVNYKSSIDNWVTYQEENINTLTIKGLMPGRENVVKIKVVDSNGDESEEKELIIITEKFRPKINNTIVRKIEKTTADLTIDASPIDSKSSIVKYRYSIDGGKTYKESSINTLTIEGLMPGMENIVKIKVIDSDENESLEKELKIVTKTVVDGVTVPEGFYYVGGTKDTGIVISDNYEDKDKGASSGVAITTLVGNQYVWIPIVNASNFIRKEWNVGTKLAACTEPLRVGYKTEAAEYYEMQEKVLSNHGFYIARYEASNNNGTAESKAMKMPWCKIKWNDSEIISDMPISGTASYEGRHASEKLGYTSVQSTLIYGVQWDCALKFIETTGVYATSARLWGNYNDASFGYYNGYKSSGISRLVPTGSTDFTMKQNINDFAGNVSEWTMEGSGGRIVRGGPYYANGSEAPPAQRLSNMLIVSSEYIGFRVALYNK